MQSNGPASCGYYSANRMQTNGPARRGYTILPNLAVISPLVADIILPTECRPMGPRTADTLSELNIFEGVRFDVLYLCISIILINLKKMDVSHHILKFVYKK